LSDFNAISYVGRLLCPELIPDIEKFLPVAIFRMATTIPHKFNIVRFQRPEFIPDIEKFLPVSIFKMAPQYRNNSTLFDFKGRFWFIFSTCCQWPVWLDYNHIVLCYERVMVIMLGACYGYHVRSMLWLLC
jgi:hypothetical protein